MLCAVIFFTVPIAGLWEGRCYVFHQLHNLGILFCWSDKDSLAVTHAQNQMDGPKGTGRCLRKSRQVSRNWKVQKSILTPGDAETQSGV